MKRVALFAFLILMFPVFILAQPQHFTFTANTGDSYSIVVTGATLDEVPLDVGDEVGVFTPADLCVGASVWTGTTPLALTAWIDDSQTSEVDGYTPGETMSFRIWDQSGDSELPATPTYAQGNGSFGDGAFATVALAAVSGGEPSGIVVTNTDDSGSGSLREAILQANTNVGPDTIRFAIPQSDPDFDSDTGTWTVQPLSPLPAITDSGLVIDGSSQADFIGSDINADGPEIVINGAQAGPSAHALQILSAQNVVQSLVINGFAQSGIFISSEKAHDNRVLGSYLGTNAAGTAAIPNTQGVYISAAPRNVIGGSEPGEGNVLSGNRDCGLLISGQTAAENKVLGNYIGTIATGDAELGNEGIGLCIFSSAHNNLIGGHQPGERNLISGNKKDGIRIAGGQNIVRGNYIGADITGSAAIGNLWDGIGIWGGDHNVIGGTNPGEGNVISANQTGILIHTNDNVILGNLIGTDINGNSLSNQFSGIHLSAGARRNQLGPRNIIAYNGLAGVRVFGSNDTTAANTITENSIYSNAAEGIALVNDGNDNVLPPDIEEVAAQLVSGQTQANAVVEIFSDSEDEGRIYEATINADNTGHFEWAYVTSDSVTGPNITATMTDGAGNTSEFSQPFNITAVEEQPEVNIPKTFSLSQNYPNPFNPETIIRYELPQKTRVVLRIINLLGEEVQTLVDEEQRPGSYSVYWNGTNQSRRRVASGVYLYRLEAGDFVAVKKMALIQ